MSLLSATNSSEHNALNITSNIFWGTNRYLMLLKSPLTKDQYPELSNNLFYAEIPEKSICIYRYTVGQNSKNIYTNEILEVSNKTIINYMQPNGSYQKVLDKSTKYLRDYIKKFLLNFS
jgi:hypothetical protein